MAATPPKREKGREMPVFPLPITHYPLPKPPNAATELQLRATISPIFVIFLKTIAMPLPKLLLSYALTALVFFAIDLLWLGLIAKNLYNRHLGPLLAERVNWTAALVFYLLFIIGIFIFAIMPAVAKNDWQQALLYGALFGFFTYATYDLTNLATLRHWPLTIALIDITWGAVLCACVSTAGFFITRYFQ